MSNLRYFPSVLAVALLSVITVADAGSMKIDDVTMPDTRQVNGVTLHLNGMGLRTFSFLDIHIYVAGLYLEHPSHDPEAILDSPETKAIAVVFVHDADKARVRKAWQIGFDNDCLPPCHLPPNEVASFMAGVPDLHKGDTSIMIFTRDYVDIRVNDVSLGLVRNPYFMRTILATYIGPVPPTERLKRGLLGLER